MSDTTTDVFTRSAADEGAPSTAPRGNGQPTAATRRRAAGLNGMVLPELQQLASTLGIKGTARMRKSQLVEAIQAAQSGHAVQPAKSATAGQAASNGSGSPTSAASAQPTTAASAQPTTTESAQPTTTESAQPTTTESAQPTTTESAPAPSAERSASEQQVGSQQPASSPDQHDRSAPRERSPQSHQDRQSSPERSTPQTQQDRSAEPGDRREEDDEGSSRSRRRRRARDRYRDRDRERDRDRGDRRSTSARTGERYDEPAVHEEDVLTPVAGIVDILDSYAFVRTSGYLPGSDDVYVSLSMVKRYGLRKGDAVTGAVRQPREGDKQQKFNALARIDTLNGNDPEAGRQRVEFGRLTPLYPQDRLRLETEPGVFTTRIIDLFAPIGKGQRGLIVSPSKAGKTMVLQSIANAITTNNPECHLMVVLVDERPEEVTDMQRAVKGEVISSTFDRPAADHTTAAELAIERAKRLVELGHDVVVLLDSITRLGRAYNLAAPASGRILSGGVDSSALYPPKRFFGAARNIEHGGSLTILATALVETGSKMDEVIFEEFKGTGNMELRLSRGLADKRVFPAMDVDASGTRKEELLMGKEELAIAWKLRRVLSGLESQQAIELLLDKLKSTRSNIEFLMQVQKTMPLPAGSGGEN